MPNKFKEGLSPRTKTGIVLSLIAFGLVSILGCGGGTPNDDRLHVAQTAQASSGSAPATEGVELPLLGGTAIPNQAGQSKNGAATSEKADTDPNCEPIYPGEGFLAVVERLGMEKYGFTEEGKAMGRSMPVDVFDSSGNAISELDNVTWNGTLREKLQNIPVGTICFSPISKRESNKKVVKNSSLSSKLFAAIFNLKHTRS